ncbi:MAG: hypothetical protein S0880_13190 [Actinomycetota bacterium]|nr:hypothetical protein [Actinomycetota bacterium]
MRRNDLARALDDARTILGDLDLVTLMRTLDRFRADGTHATAFDQPAVATSAPADSPTERHALGRSDEAADLQHRVLDVTARVHADLIWLDRIRRNWTTEPDRAAANTPTNGCELCNTYPAHQTDARGNLDPKRRLCRACKDFTIRQGRPPTAAELRGGQRRRRSA